MTKPMPNKPPKSQGQKGEKKTKSGAKKMTESSKLKNAMAEFGGMGTTSAQGGPGGKGL